MGLNENAIAEQLRSANLATAELTSRVGAANIEAAKAEMHETRTVGTLAAVIMGMSTELGQLHARLDKVEQAVVALALDPGPAPEED